MALVVGELTAYLTVNKDAYRRGVQEARGELRDLARDADRQATATDNRSGRMVTTVSSAMAQVGRDADRQGRDAGGKLSQGISQGIVRNSPLIVAAVGGALAAGGPLAMAGATALFAGVGIVAAAQSQKVQSAWVGTWDHIKAAAIHDAGVIQPVLVRMADDVGASYDRMRPRIQGAFSAAAPQVQVFANGVLGLAENAMPALERAIERGMPVTMGLASFLEKTGSGLGGFFDNISTHGPAAGQVFSELGDSMDLLLPTLGELLGQGAELASDVLPLLNGSLGLVLTVTKALGPALPVVAAGFGAFKIARTVTGWVSGLGGALDGLAKKTGVASVGTGKVGTALSAVGAAAPLVGIGVGLIGVAMERSAQEAQGWSEALGRGYDMLNSGGAAAASAQAQFDALSAKVRDTGSSFDITGGAARVISDQMNEARAHAHDLWEQMDPLAQAQAKVAEWTSTLSFRLQDENSSAQDVAIAKERLKYWSDQQSAADDKLQTAIHGVTQAMIDQANQALAAVDSQFAYQDATYRVADAQKALKDAQDHLNDSNKNTRTTTDDVNRAATALGEALSNQAQAAGRAAADASGLTDKMDLQQVAAAGTLQELYRLRDQYGSALPASLQQAIGRMEAAGVNLDILGKKHPTATAALNAAPLNSTYAGAMRVLSILAGQRPMPIATLRADTRNAEYYLNLAARNRTSTVYMKTVTVAERAGGGPVEPIRAAVGRKVAGPGGPTDDLVRALGPGGSDYRLSPGEWIVNAMTSRREGDGKMALLNAGLATIVPLRSSSKVRALAGGGSAATGSASAAEGGASGRSVVIHVDKVSVEGTFDLASSRDLRKAGQVIRKVIIGLEREEK